MVIKSCVFIRSPFHYEGHEGKKDLYSFVAHYGGYFLSHAKEPRQDSLLGVETIVRLREDHRMRSICHIIGKLVIAMRRQTVHHNHILVCFADQTGIDLVRREDLLALSS